MILSLFSQIIGFVVVLEISAELKFSSPEKKCFSFCNKLILIALQISFQLHRSWQLKDIVPRFVDKPWALYMTKRENFIVMSKFTPSTVKRMYVLSIQKFTKFKMYDDANCKAIFTLR